MIAAALLLLMQTAQAPAPPARAPAQGVQLGTEVRPETVSVGQHFVAMVRVRAPAGTTLRFPSRPDTTAAVDTIARPRRSDAPGAFADATVQYPLAAWDTGVVRLGLGDVVVASAAGERVVSLAGLAVYVRSVLPADTSLRKPRPPRPPVVVPAFDWRPIFIGLALLLAALIAYAVWRWLRRPRPPESAAAWAERELRRLEATGWQAAAPERFVAGVADVLRGYLARQFGMLGRSATTSELYAALAAEPIVPRDRVATLLAEADLVKFAARRATPDAAGRTTAEVRAVIAQVERDLAAARVAARNERTREPKRAA